MAALAKVEMMGCWSQAGQSMLHNGDTCCCLGPPSEVYVSPLELARSNSVYSLLPLWCSCILQKLHGPVATSVNMISMIFKTQIPYDLNGRVLQIIAELKDGYELYSILAKYAAKYVVTWITSPCADHVGRVYVFCINRYFDLSKVVLHLPITLSDI